VKAETQKPGIFRRIAAVLTRNWSLKLLALILAIVVYCSLKTDNFDSARNENDRKLFTYR
jgi:YbbR domain-containing protein